MATHNYFVRLKDVPGYHPVNHTGTTNRRLIGPDTVGAQHLEVLHGTLQKGKGAQPHAHPGMEQVCYILEGRALAEIDGQEAELGPGDCCYFPPDVMHVFTAISDEPVKILVIYSPPYGEDPNKVRCEF
ncbi:cupin domain-containing protein [Jejubacter calystegiae]|uniref:Cupin domain-containing protein n=1 Tax=Jejubacter calystegiae TaxID=2579935 RepID=A0A4P8YFV1_9ENTR|nr:cupin domain-containing protein [Jejubacter calystegiae]QCT19535.1 cupin domain-containing protein [Jejubacter calystegiae]